MGHFNTKIDLHYLDQRERAKLRVREITKKGKKEYYLHCSHIHNSVWILEKNRGKMSAEMQCRLFLEQSSKLGHYTPRQFQNSARFLPCPFICRAYKIFRSCWKLALENVCNTHTGSALPGWKKRRMKFLWKPVCHLRLWSLWIKQQRKKSGRLCVCELVSSVMMVLGLQIFCMFYRSSGQEKKLKYAKNGKLTQL